MKMELPVRLANPLILCVMFISIAGFDFFGALGFGFWKYVIGTMIAIGVLWLLHKSGLNEKKVPIWVGAFIIILGFTTGIIIEKLVEVYI